MVRQRDVPVGRIARFSRLARVGARSGMSFLVGDDGSAAAEQVADLLGNLRGLAAKVGQMASYVDGAIPEAQRATYERALAKLRNATQHSSFDKVRATLERELGAPLVERFAEFDPEPIASASVGQVHRARLHDGREVAVKVQHPGIADAIEADLSNAGSLVGVISLAGPRGMNVREIHEEVAQHFRNELDYRLEAQRQRQFGATYAGDSAISVPAIITTHTTGRVLTSELVRGRDFAQITAAPEAERALFAATLWRFVFRGVLVEGVFNADPHPGNYIFHDQGRITFLDFGCVQVLDPEVQAAARSMHQSALDRDEPAFRAAAARLSRTRPGPFETELLDYLWCCFDPLKSAPFRFDRAYVTELVQRPRRFKRHLFSRGSNATAPPAGVVLLNRLQFGFYSVLAKLEAPVDYATIQRELLARPSAAPSGR